MLPLRLRPSPAKERPVRDYTPEYESFRDDAVAVINGLAIMFAVVGTWPDHRLRDPGDVVVAGQGRLLGR